MHGNVWEWCQDTWHQNHSTATNDGSAWVSGGSSSRVVRGGSWFFNPRVCRSAYRICIIARGSSNEIGFRVMLCVKPRNKFQ
jgi:formylglycine-generating enzyme required for sulfatase activity